MSKDQLNKKTDVEWEKKKRYIWIVGAAIILALVLYYVLSKNEQSIRLISFISSVSSIVLAFSTIIISKNYNRSTGEVLEHIDSSVEAITDELQHRLNDLEDMKVSINNFPSSIQEKKELLYKIEKMEEAIITSPLLASERSQHEDNEIRNYERKIRAGQRKLYKYENDLTESSSEREKIRIQEKKSITEEKIKSADEQLKGITDKQKME